MSKCLITAILFLTLVSVTTNAWKGLHKDNIAKLSSCWIQDLRLSLLCLLNKWKEKQLERVSIILYPEANLGLRESKEENTSLNWLSISTTEPLIIFH